MGSPGSSCGARADSTDDKIAALADQVSAFVTGTSAGFEALTGRVDTLATQIGEVSSNIATVANHLEAQETQCQHAPEGVPGQGVQNVGAHSCGE